jgi:hypothetical protein
VRPVVTSEGATPLKVARPSTSESAALREPLRTSGMQFAKQTLTDAHVDPGAGSARRAPLTWIMLGLLATAWLGLHFAAGQVDNPATAIFAERLTVFVLAVFVGWQVVWGVAPALHTPLMGVTNAISGIILLGGMLHTSGHPTSAPVLLGIAAVLLATINVSGGFLVTRRMLKMFRK